MAPPTDFPVEPDNSSGLPHDSPSERLSHTKATFQHKKHRKKHRGHQKASKPPKPSTGQLSSMLIRSGVGAKARRAASKPKPYPPPCPEPWKERRRHQVGLHGSMPQSPKSSRLGSHRSRLPIPLGWDCGSPRTVRGLPRGSRLTLLPARVSPLEYPLEYGASF